MDPFTHHMILIYKREYVFWGVLCIRIIMVRANLIPYPFFEVREFISDGINHVHHVLQLYACRLAFFIITVKKTISYLLKDVMIVNCRIVKDMQQGLLCERQRLWEQIYFAWNKMYCHTAVHLLVLEKSGHRQSAVSIKCIFSWILRIFW